MQLDGYIVGLIKQGVNALMGNLPELDALFKYLSRNYNIQILGEQVNESGNNSYICKIDGVEYEILIEQGNVWLVDAQGKAEYLGQMVSRSEKQAPSRSKNPDKTEVVVVDVAAEEASSSEIAVSVAIVSSDAYDICDPLQSCPESSDSTALANSARPFSLSAPICRTPEDEKNLQPEGVVAQRQEAIKAAPKTEKAVESAATEKPAVAPAAESKAVSEEAKAVAQKGEVKGDPAKVGEVPADVATATSSGFASDASTLNSGSVSTSGPIVNTNPTLPSGFVPPERGFFSSFVTAAVAVFDAAVRREEDQDRRMDERGKIFIGTARNGATDGGTTSHISGAEAGTGSFGAVSKTVYAGACGSEYPKVAFASMEADDGAEGVEEEREEPSIRSGHRLTLGEGLFGAGEQSFVFGGDPIEIARACAMSGLWPACLMVAFASQSRPAVPVSEIVRRGTGTQVASANARRGHGDEGHGRGSGDGRREEQVYSQFSEEA